MRRFVVILLLMAAFTCAAADRDTLLVDEPRKHSELEEMLREFSRVDTNYIEPQKYNFTLMLQNTNTYEIYTLRTRSGGEVRFAPDWSIKLGPYIGWRWVFLGYTVDLRHLFNSDSKREIDLSLYAPQVGIDLFYRTTGKNYYIRALKFDEADIDGRPMRNTRFSGFHAKIKGFNFYYIFNHHKFSYPAAFSQSTVQRRSAGSALVGIGYTDQSINVEWDKFSSAVTQKLGKDVVRDQLDSTIVSGHVKYKDYNVSGGYAYNWVFARNWLLAASVSLALSYKRTESNERREQFSLRNFDFSNFNLDGVGRFGVVYNNMKWYVGTSAIFHTYNYQKSKFSTNTSFGSINIYAGFNFGRKK